MEGREKLPFHVAICTWIIVHSVHQPCCGVCESSKLGPGPNRIWAEFPMISLTFCGLHNKVYALFQYGLARYSEVRSKWCQQMDFILVLS